MAIPLPGFAGAAPLTAGATERRWPPGSRSAIAAGTAIAFDELTYPPDQRGSARLRSRSRTSPSPIDPSLGLELAYADRAARDDVLSARFARRPQRPWLGRRDRSGDPRPRSGPRPDVGAVRRMGRRRRGERQRRRRAHPNAPGGRHPGSLDDRRQTEVTAEAARRALTGSTRARASRTTIPSRP